MEPLTDPTSQDLQEENYRRVGLQKLNADEIEALESFGQRRTLADGEHLFRTGDRDLSVFVVIRGEDLNKSMSSYLVRRIEQTPNVELLRRTQIVRCMGDGSLCGVEMEDLASHARRTVDTPALFSFIGAAPRTRWLPPQIERDEKGFIKTGRLVRDSTGWPQRDREPLSMETSRPGVFAAGDVRAGSTKRCAAAVGEGGQAVECVHQFLGNLLPRTPTQPA